MADDDEGPERAPVPTTREVLPESSESASIAYDGLARRIPNGVWPVVLRKTLTKWEASENPARRPISAVVTRSKSGD
jgi:hypothetical protein